MHVESCAHAGAQCGVVSFPDPLLSRYYVRTFSYHFFNGRVEGLGTRLSVVQTQWCSHSGTNVHAMCMPCACHVHVESCAHAGAQCGADTVVLLYWAALTTCGCAWVMMSRCGEREGKYHLWPDTTMYWTTLHTTGCMDNGQKLLLIMQLLFLQPISMSGIYICYIQ